MNTRIYQTALQALQATPYRSLSSQILFRTSDLSFRHSSSTYLTEKQILPLNFPFVCTGRSLRHLRRWTGLLQSGDILGRVGKADLAFPQAAAFVEQQWCGVTMVFECETMIDGFPQNNCLLGLPPSNNAYEASSTNFTQGSQQISPSLRAVTK